MIIDSEDVPLPAGKPVIGLIYNVKKDIKGELPDEEAEFDSYDNVCALAAAIKNTGADVIMLEADKELPEKLVKTKMDMAFSIAEGFNGRAREAQVQAILEMLGIRMWVPTRRRFAWRSISRCASGIFRPSEYSLPRLSL